jgi:hypothetical protein
MVAIPFTLETPAASTYPYRFRRSRTISGRGGYLVVSVFSGQSVSTVRRLEEEEQIIRK